MMKIFITSSAWPTSLEVIAEAVSYGAGEIIHRPLPHEFAELADGYHEIPDASEEPV